jgi:hypothetical protein
LLTDSPYDAGPSVIDARTGALAGGLGAMAMALIIVAINGEGFRMAPFFERIGAVFGPNLGAGADPIRMAVGVVAHVGLGVVFGMLYASCLRRQPTASLVAVSISYGLMLWIIPGFPLNPIFADETRRVLRSPAWLVGCLVYSAMLLGITLVWLRNGRATPTRAH